MVFMATSAVSSFLPVLADEGARGARHLLIGKTRILHETDS